MEDKKTIIFDMDGTLLDSSKSITKSINYVRKTLDLPPFSVKTVVKLINEPDNNLPKLFYEDKKPYNECRKIFEKHYFKNCIIDIKLYDGIKEMLENLENGYNFSVATNAYGLFAKKMIEHLKIDHYFQLILGADDVNAKKPDPTVIEYTIKKLSTNKTNTVMIGDSLKDEQAAKNAGIKYIYASWGFGEYKEPDFILLEKDLQNINKIQKIISGMIG